MKLSILKLDNNQVENGFYYYSKCDICNELFIYKTRTIFTTIFDLAAYEMMAHGHYLSCQNNRIEKYLVKK